MDVLLQGPSDATWTAVAGLLQGLKAAAGSGEPVMIHTADPTVEVGEITALIGVFRSFGGHDEMLSLASPYPATDWISRVRAAGIERIWYVVPDLRPLRLRLKRQDLIEVPRDLCPALHVRKLDGCPTSVCGNMLDRLVLARHLFVDHCFGSWRECRWHLGMLARREEPCTSSSSGADASARRSQSPAPTPAMTSSSSIRTPPPSASSVRGSTG